ncbi:unnamed protein product, partial [Sphacelaria rigidula]
TQTQVLNITAAVIVTTPQKLSFTDVVKGIDLFDTVNVPSVAVVENMAYYNAVNEAELQDGLQESIAEVLRLENDELSAAASREGLDLLPRDEVNFRAAVIASMVKRRAEAKTPQFIFGKGHRGRLADMWGITNTVQLPLVEEVASCGDTGTPYMISNAEGSHGKAFLELAEAVVREVAKLRYTANERPMLSFQPAAGTITIDTTKGSQVMPAADLRRRCRCALCVEEFSGRPLLDPATVPEDIVPSGFAPIGNYAVSVQWSDGHSSLYPYSAFAEYYE